MYSNRPKIKIPLTITDKILNIVALAILIAHLILIVFNIKNLPQQIPTHYGLSGTPDAFGSKSTLIILPIIALLIYVLFFVLTKFPNIHNYPVNINEKNALYFYKLSNGMLRILNVIINTIFIYITFGTIQIAKANANTLSPVILFVSIGLIFICVIYFLVKIFSYKEIK